ncbi:hypothetical protein SAMN03159316_3284 [Pseudomonas sp. NFR02]|nr:hypothetical protein SAMN03159316_3284 [Pseudomonas sp. NFR02]VVO64682.1 hypothetical protein PS887_00978 [Pseudomonas fluorescens]
MVVSHRRWAQSYAGVELCVNFVNRLYLGDIRLSGERRRRDESLKSALNPPRNTLSNKSDRADVRE